MDKISNSFILNKGDLSKAIEGFAGDWVWFDVNTGYLTFIIHIQEPTEKEIEECINSKITFGFSFVLGCFICHMKIGNLGWYDGIYYNKFSTYMHSFYNQPFLDYNEATFEEEKPCHIDIVFTDTDSRRIFHKRNAYLTKETIQYMKKCLRRQKGLAEILEEEQPFNPTLYLNINPIQHYDLNSLHEKLKYKHIAEA